MKLQHYFDRVGYRGPSEPNVETLAALQQAHVCSVPFENLDVQLGRPLSIGIEDAYEKIVVTSRGGWCYEQNGLFGWVLTQLGFDVTRIAGSVMRVEKGEASAATHLCLLVRPPDSGISYLVDVGFGGSMLAPIALQEARYEQPPFTLGLTRLDEHYWRFFENMGNGDFSFDFVAAPAAEQSLNEKSVFQQSHPSSNFVLNLGVQLRTKDGHRALRGRVLTVATSGGISSYNIDTPEALISILADEFGLNVPEAAVLWPKITARHQELFG